MSIIESFIDPLTTSGLYLVSDTPGTSLPAKGKLYKLHTYKGVETIEFIPDPEGYWIQTGPILEPIFGCVIVRKLSCVSHNQYLTILAGGDRMAYRNMPVDRGAQGGLPEVTVLDAGVEIPVTISELEAVGIISIADDPIVVDDIPAVPSQYDPLFT